ncbi:MAG: hypothetical protein K6G12_06350 [Lachnospiraceae bacterium]|nr:hypothetical protein [Lachnospiraceae bacterium]
MRKIKRKTKKVIIGAAIGTMITAALLLSAFAFSDVDVSASERVVEEMAGDGTYMTAQAAELDTVISEEGVTENPLGDLEEATEEDVVRNVENLGADKDYLSEMDKEEIKDLSAEALNNEGLDTSVADGAVVTRGITYNLPEGFIEDPDYPGMYVTERYPIDASNMVYTELDADYTLQLMDEAYFEETVENIFASRYGQAIDVTITEYTSYEIDNIPALRVKVEYDLADNHVTSLMIIVNGTKTYTVIYTQNHDYDRMELFEASAASIHVQR